MSRYRLGADAEMRVVQILRDEGWQVIGSAGPQSPFDVVAMGSAGRIAVQVSRSSGTTKSSTKELKEVQAAAECLPAGMTVELWVYSRGGKPQRIPVRNAGGVG